MTAPPVRPSDLETLRDFAHGDIREGFERLEAHSADLVPRAYIVSAAGFGVVLIDPRTIASKELEASLFAATLPAAIAAARTRVAAVTYTVFGAFHKPVSELSDAERRAISAGEVPGAWPARKHWRKPEEQLLVIQSAEREEMWWAPIVRIHQQPPQLGYWAQLNDPATLARVFAPIRAALKDARPRPGSAGPPAQPPPRQ